ncbi:MAG: OmpA family protein [Gemmatimonadaceae bacterium]
MPHPSLALALVALVGALLVRSAEAQTSGKGAGAVSLISVRQLAQRLAGGRVELPGVRFAAGSDRLDPASVADVDLLAAALRETTGVFAIEAHLAPGPGAQALSMRRAAALQSRLVAAGVEADRLFATGVAAAPLPSADGRDAERIAISRLR